MFAGLKLVSVLCLVYYVCAECNIPDIDCRLDVMVKFKDGDSVKCQDVANDNQYDFEKAPEIKYIAADKTKKYTLIMVDPDAPRPDNPTSKYFLHWIVRDIPGGDLQNNWKSDKSGQALVEYMKPMPSFGTHRYQFYLTEQEPVQTFLEPSTRAKFDLEAFINDNNLCSIVASYQYKVKSTQ